MDGKRRKQIKRWVDEELQLGAARLFRAAEEKRVLEEIAEKKEVLFSNFKGQGPKKELELTTTLLRLLMNFTKLASYYGVLKGYRLFTKELELRKDSARFYLIMYLQTHPKAENKELVAYLDRKNGRLFELKTRDESRLWAWLPRLLERKFNKGRIQIVEGEFWEAALRKFPQETMVYLSRTRKMARQNKVKNALIAWPRIIKEHRKRRSRA